MESSKLEYLFVLQLTKFKVPLSQKLRQISSNLKSITLGLKRPKPNVVGLTANFLPLEITEDYPRQINF